MKLFNHVQIKVQDLKTSQKLYDSIMNILNYKIVLHIENTVIGYGTDIHDMFKIRQANNESLLSKSIHLAFNAPNIRAVDNFHKTTI